MVAREAALIGRKFCLSSRIFYYYRPCFYPAKLQQIFKTSWNAKEKQNKTIQKRKRNRGKLLRYLRCFVFVAAATLVV